MLYIEKYVKDNSIDLTKLISSEIDADYRTKIMDALGPNVLGRPAEYIKKKARIPIEICNRLEKLGSEAFTFYKIKFLEGGNYSSSALEHTGILHHKHTSVFKKNFMEQFNQTIVKGIHGEGDFYEYLMLVLHAFYSPSAQSLVSKVTKTVKKEWIYGYFIGGREEDVLDKLSVVTRVVIKRALDLLREA